MDAAAAAAPPGNVGVEKPAADDAECKPGAESGGDNGKPVERSDSAVGDMPR